ncbi:MAG: S28 family serine protease [Bacteroidales bacterium]|nr:S28 family serine protease [Bacteroidales bacterium]
MKIIKLLLFILGIQFTQSFSIQAQAVKENLTEIGFDSVREFQINIRRYQNAYELFVAQPLNHKKPELGTFSQRVIIRHRGFDKPTVFVTEGYAAGYALWADYDEELSEALDANLVVVEHRFFGKSVPVPKDWKQLTLANATADLHRINQILKQIYTGPWISTGISKGGQTTIYYRFLYPDDVVASVPYVAPLNFSVADKRVYHFLDTVGTADCRMRLLDLQKDLLKRRDIFEPMFADSSAKRKLSFNMVGGIEKAFEYNVLEFGFAYWQWYPIGCEGLPEAGSDKNDVFNAFVAAAGYDFFADQSILDFQPFFYQALTEMGFYSYETKPFQGLLKHIEKPTFNHTLPDGMKVKYCRRLSKRTDRWLRKKGNNFIYVYGGYDAWSSTAVQHGTKTNAMKLVLPSGSHITRLGNFDDATRDNAINTLKQWIEKDY